LLGDAKRSLGDAKRSLGDAKRSLGDAKRLLGDAKRSLGDAQVAPGSTDAVRAAAPDWGTDDGVTAAAAVVWVAVSTPSPPPRSKRLKARLKSVLNFQDPEGYPVETRC
jgi:hypothetical protein